MVPGSPTACRLIPPAGVPGGEHGVHQLPSQQTVGRRPVQRLRAGGQTWAGSLLWRSGRRSQTGAPVLLSLYGGPQTGGALCPHHGPRAGPHCVSPPGPQAPSLEPLGAAALLPLTASPARLEITNTDILSLSLSLSPLTFCWESGSGYQLSGSRTEYRPPGGTGRSL